MAIINVVSSSVFTTNAFAGYWTQQLDFFFISSFLTLTSWMYHYTERYSCKIVDVSTVFVFAIFGFYKGFRKKFWLEKNRFFMLVALVCLLTVTSLYFYGMFTGNFCFHPEYGWTYHAFLHGFSSLGNHCIICMS